MNLERTIHMMDQRYVAEEQRMLPCRYLMGGYCKEGPRCRFYHPPPNKLHTAIRCPPLPPGFDRPAHRRGNTPPRRYAAPPTYDYVLTPRPTQCYFGQEPDVTMRSVSDMRFDGSRSYNQNDIGQEGDARRTMPNFVTSTYQNGLVSYNYNYPNQQGSEVQYREPDEEATTMFTHINWNDYLLPGVSAPPVVNVPLEDMERPHRGRSFLDRTVSVSPHEFETEAENLDTPPEGLVEKKMTAREEFQLKIKSIAVGLAEEPVLSVRSLDSYFNDYKDLDSLPPEMIERNETLLSTNKNATDPKYPPIPELVEGELLESDDESNTTL